MSLFDIKEYDITNKKRNLQVSASGVVSSTKYFPVFEENGKEFIFKPLSKTKPLSTPLFAYSEVYWSHLIKKCIDPKTPQYRLAICRGLSEEQPKYYEKGTIVENVLQNEESLINILELFKKYPDSLVDIDNYVNYCEVQYDYEPILRSAFFTERKDLGESLAEQILTSILRRDDNYHYENVSLLEEENKFKTLAPIIDLEFSEMFMHPDNEEEHKLKFSEYDEGMSAFFTYDNSKSYEENYAIFISKLKNGSIYDKYGSSQANNLRKNINTIVELYPEVVKKFIKKLEAMKEEVENLSIEFNDDFLGEFSSKDWKPTRMLFKEGKTEDDYSYKCAKSRAEKSRIKLDHDKFNSQLKKEVLWSIHKLITTLKLFLDVYDNRIPNIKAYFNETLYGKLNRKSEEELEYIYNFFNQINRQN